MGLIERLKKQREKHVRGQEAEQIYKRERELAYEQAQRQHKWNMAMKGEKPQKKGGIPWKEWGKQWLRNVEKGQREDPLGLFNIVGAKPQKKRRRKRR